jgi:hypothetical protein
VLIDVSSELATDAVSVWQQVSTPAGVNYEFWPLRMTFPRDIPSIDKLPTGQNLLLSRIALLGVLPLDWHHFGLARADPGRGFHEISISLWMARWIHIRSVTPHGMRCTVRDHVECTPRFLVLTPLITTLYCYIFERRHDRLRRHFGGKRLA